MAAIFLVRLVRDVNSLLSIGSQRQREEVDAQKQRTPSDLMSSTFFDLPMMQFA